MRSARVWARGYSRTMNDETPKLHIDSDWKAQAQAEKDRLSEKESARAAASGGAQHRGQPGAQHGPQHGPQHGAQVGAQQGDHPDEGELPPADFRALVATLASQAMMGLGAYADPQSGRAVIDIQGAQFAIDLLGVIEEKTRGNLTADEASELTEILAQLRARFVQIAKLVAAQMQREMAGGGMQGAMQGGGMQGGGPVGSIGLGGPSGGPTTTKSGLIIPD